MPDPLHNIYAANDEVAVTRPAQCRPKRLSFVLHSALAVMNVYMAALGGTLAYFCRNLQRNTGSDAAILECPATDSSTLGPLVWIYIGLVALLTPVALGLLSWDFLRTCRDKDRFCREKSCNMARLVLLLFGALFPAIVFWQAAKMKAFSCVAGFPGFAKGGACRCDSRTLLSTDGTPEYLNADAIKEPVTIAFIGDSDNENVEEVYRLIGREGNVSAVVFNGDLDYKQEHRAWKERFERFLGSTPFYVTVGNHDTSTWRDYQEMTREHYRCSNVTQCHGTIGVQEECSHQGIGLLLSGAGSSCGGLHSEHTPFFTETLQQFQMHNVTWRICIFHKQQGQMQVGSKLDSVGWDKYEECLQRGAIIFNSHEHVYGRTHELSKMSEHNVVVSQKVPKGSPASQALQVGAGRSLVVLNGLGGGKVRSLSAERVSDPWWAVASGNADKVRERIDGFGPDDPGATFGAFFCTFRVNGDPRLARCYMKDVNGHLVDDFYMRSVN